MSPKQILRGQPWYVCAQWWALTLLLLIIVSPLLGISLINPFWFRQGFFDVVEEFAHYLRRWRDKVMKPQLDKYKLFDKLKEI